MKKIILALLISFTALSADYVINPEGTLTPTTTQDATTPPPADTWVGEALPTKAFNVLDYGLKGDGVTDDSAALNALANNTSVTNWYFPADKSFLLTRIDIPSHVHAVYGKATIISKAYDDGRNTYGAFRILNSDHAGLIIDGLTFEGEDSVNWMPEAGNWYGHITFEGGTILHDFEIRNCTFDMANVDFNGIKGFGTDCDNRNLNIHHNTFINIPRFGIEIIAGNDYRTPDGSARTIKNAHIHDNTFNSSTGIGISFIMIRGGVGNTGVADGTESYIYNNTFTNLSWAMEIGGTSGVVVHNNIATGITSDLLSNGGSVIDTGVNFFYDNDLRGDSTGTAQLLIYDGNKDEFYNNYFDGRIVLDDRRGGSEWDVNFHDNILVQNIGSATSSAIIHFNGITKGTFNKNTIYGTSGISRAFLIYSNTGGTDIVITNNTSNMMKATARDVDNLGSPITESNNILNSSYTGTSPTK